MAEGESADLREFIREIALRVERAVQAMEAGVAAIDRKTDAVVEEIRLQRTVLEEAVAENRAEREALFRILDRLDNGGTAPAA